MCESTIQLAESNVHSDNMSPENVDDSIRKNHSMATTQADESRRQIRRVQANDVDESTSFKFPFFYVRCIVPEQNPILWIVISNSLAISGFLLILTLAYAKTRVEKGPVAFAFYLVWEFLACMFWTLESTLSLSYRHFELHLRNHSWYSKVELVTAAYFTNYAGSMLVEWNVHDREVTTGYFWEVGFNTTLLCLQYYSKLHEDYSKGHIQDKKSKQA